MTSTVGGGALGLEEYGKAIIIFAITVLISLIGLLIYRIISKLRSRDE